MGKNEIRPVRDFAQKLINDRRYPHDFMGLVPDYILSLEVGRVSAYELDDEMDQLIALTVSGQDEASEFLKDLRREVYFFPH